MDFSQHRQVPFSAYNFSNLMTHSDFVCGATTVTSKVPLSNTDVLLLFLQPKKPQPTSCSKRRRALKEMPGEDCISTVENLRRMSVTHLNKCCLEAFFKCLFYKTNWRIAFGLAHFSCM